MLYYLMNKDNPVAKFTIEQGLIDDVYTWSRIHGQKMPIGFKDIQSWIDNRKGSKHNAHLKKIMEMCGCEKTEGFIRVTHAASINDTFWVKAATEDLTWKRISLYQNEFNQVISKLAFEGVGLYGIRLSGTSPELSTEGSFRKCWRREGDNIFLYKRGEEGARNVGLEPYSEVMTSELAVKVCKNAVRYELTHLHGALASKCLLFTNEQYGYVPIANFPVNHKSADDMLKFYGSIKGEDSYRRMLVLDALTFNVDRHAGNHGVLINNDTLEPVQMAPIFDMNLALLPYVEQNEFTDIGTKLLEYGPRIGDDFTKVGRMAMTPEIRSELIGLKGFTFTFRGDDTYPEWRVKKIEEMVNRQIEALLNKEILNTKDVFVPALAYPEKIEQEPSPQSPLERRADDLAAKIMESGKFLCYDLENYEDDIRLILFPAGKNDAEIRVSMLTQNIWVEIAGEGITRFECATEFPAIAAAYDIADQIIHNTEPPFFTYEKENSHEIE